jgi:uncharacterized protein with PIN domain
MGDIAQTQAGGITISNFDNHRCEKCNKSGVDEVSAMQIEVVGNVVCAVKAQIMRCSVRTCQHTYMTGPQLKAFKAQVYAEYHRKKDIQPKWGKVKVDIIED